MGGGGNYGAMASTIFGGVMNAGWTTEQAQYYEQMGKYYGAMTDYQVNQVQFQASAMKQKAQWMEYNAAIDEASAQMTRNLGEYNKAVKYREAVQISEATGEDALELRKQGSLLLSQQRTGYLKSGVALEGTPLAMLLETESAINDDVSTLMRNGRLAEAKAISEGNLSMNEAELQALGLESNALNTRMEAWQLNREATITRRSAAYVQYMGDMQRYINATVPGWASETEAKLTKWQTIVDSFAAYGGMSGGGFSSASGMNTGSGSSGGSISSGFSSVGNSVNRYGGYQSSFDRSSWRRY